MSNDEVEEAYSRLRAMKEHLPRYGSIHVKYVNEYHEILALLETASSKSLSNFRIPPREVRPVVEGGNYDTGELYYSEDPYVDREFMLMKLGAVLNLFQLRDRSGDVRFTP